MRCYCCIEDSPRSSFQEQKKAVDKNKRVDYEAMMLSEKIKSQQQVRVIMADNDVMTVRVKWFTNHSLGTADGKIISRAHIKIIETELE